MEADDPAEDELLQLTAELEDFADLDISMEQDEALVVPQGDQVECQNEPGPTNQRSAKLPSEAVLGHPSSTNLEIDIDSKRPLDASDHCASIKKRLGSRDYLKILPHKSHHLFHSLNVTENDSVVAVAKEIAFKLHECKKSLIEHVVETIGVIEAIDLFYRTQETEACGGMLTADGKRRREAGGVFLHLLKERYPADVVKKILQVDKRLRKDHLSEQTKKKMKKIKKLKNRLSRLTNREQSLTSSVDPADSMATADTTNTGITVSEF